MLKHIFVCDNPDCKDYGIEKTSLFTVVVQSVSCVSCRKPMRKVRSEQLTDTESSVVGLVGGGIIGGLIAGPSGALVGALVGSILTTPRKEEKQ